MAPRTTTTLMAGAVGLTFAIGCVLATTLGGGHAVATDHPNGNLPGRKTPSAEQPMAAPATPSPTSTVAVPIAPALPTLPPLGHLVEADVLVRSTAPLPAAMVHRLVVATKAEHALMMSSATVSVGRGRTVAAAADPAAMRVWTAAPTARATGVWQRVAAGQVAMAHAVAAADAVPLGATATMAGPAGTLPFRVGALATSGIPGVGVLVDPAAGSRLGLVPATALLLSAPGRDPAVSAALAAKVLGERGSAVPFFAAAAPTGRWVAPVTGEVTSPFGMRTNPITGKPEFHAGIDVGAPLGAPIYAMSDGEVLYAGAASGFGQEIVLQHARGVSTVYGHVSQLLVTGGHVRVGQLIALVGSEGESTGPHLHLEVRVDGQPVDPLTWLARHGVRIH